MNLSHPYTSFVINNKALLSFKNLINIVGIYRTKFLCILNNKDDKEWAKDYGIKLLTKLCRLYFIIKVSN